MINDDVPALVDVVARWSTVLGVFPFAHVTLLAISIAIVVHPMLLR